VRAVSGWKQSATALTDNVLNLWEPNPLLDDFVSSLSHDLRTPLAAIKASVGVLLANEPPDLAEPLHRMLINIDFAADEMADMVANLLELVRVEGALTSSRSHLHDLRSLANRVAETFEPMAHRRAQLLEMRLPATPLIAYCYAGGIQRALLNLLSNAHKFAPEGTTIRLHLHRQRGRAIFTVADSGPGVADAEREYIFDRSRQPRVNSMSGKRGAGLGLPVVRSVAELHGGRVWVASRPGEGAAFRVSLPVMLAPPSLDRIPWESIERASNTISQAAIGGIRGIR
jgi:signal transduction histidine kinase